MEEKTTKKPRRNYSKAKEVEKPVEVKEEVVNKSIVEKVVKPAKLNIRKSPEKGDNILTVITGGNKVKVHTDVAAGKGWSFIEAEIAPGVTAEGYVMTEFLG